MHDGIKIRKTDRKEKKNHGALGVTMLELAGLRSRLVDPQDR